MASYNIPGVYVEEIATLPNTVAGVSTAVPAFIGCTEKHNQGKVGPVARISTMLEYRAIYGGAPPSALSLTVNTADGQSSVVSLSAGEVAYEYRLYYSLSLYFQNGGGSCYVVSVGDYATAPTNDHFLEGLAALEKEDEPTLILLTDALGLAAADYYNVCQAALAQCQKLKDRFTIVDVPDGTSPTAFRTGLASEYLSYGAAYHPYLQTTLNYEYDPANVSVTTGSQQSKLSDLSGSNTALYNQIRSALTQERVVLPPSPAIAGIYASVDRNRGVWKAPANVSISAVLGPVAKITADEQEKLNIDATSGKSINAIRAFTGKGTLVWGARTLDGNSNEWRYVSIRRLFIMIEESLQKATAFAVFEPNDTSTWLKVKAMIESYLYGLWEQGALAGATPEAAYFVQVGLGKTMTTDDVLAGRMIVEVGIAAVRPAEFIVLRFTHKLQQA